ncbi:MAG: hypothetical protein IPH06_04055 [Alphaproteobacteria bacterium]|nr:hypothetical protein [Alphaproteobacteria bacterium]QQS58645.1 MAG: hypothetical protein IPN28_13370 [Alphaproteobacteria bacterium]
MTNKKSREAALEFLEYLAQKGLTSPTTARARKAALGKVLGILDDNEAQDVTTLNLDEVVSRFANLHGKDYTPESLATYKSRVKSALDDFTSYLSNPLAFKPNMQTRERKLVTDKAATGKGQVSGNKTQETVHHIAPVVTGSMANSILPIPIRADLTIHIQGLPYDLTETEANKIASVVKAMASTT